MSFWVYVINNQKILKHGYYFSGQWSFACGNSSDCVSTQRAKKDKFIDFRQAIYKLINEPLKAGLKFVKDDLFVWGFRPNREFFSHMD